MTSALLEKYPNMTLLHLFKPGYKPMSKSISMDISVSHLYRKKNPRAKRASGGITLLIKLHLFQGVKIYKCDDKFLWWKLDRSFFVFPDDMGVTKV